MPIAAVHHNKRLANVGPAERAISLIAGGWMLVDGILKRGFLRKAEVLAGGYLLYRGMYGHCPLYQAMGKKAQPDMVRNINIHFRESIDRPRWELYNIWRQLERLPDYLSHIEKVEILNDKESIWTARIPGGVGKLSWNAMIVHEEPGYQLGWTSQPGAAVEASGKVTFLVNEKGGTDLQVLISYRPPLGAIGAAAGKLMNHSFEQLIRQDLAGLKDKLELHHV
ncbi:SRPBCC family protein [Flavihumibacter petaseus]|uniref:Uncharacterized protein n=1 Tax=Flavihumibacter petaseus NBRC 106054 TaxID=1220578 RepID=A0A0E9MV06_9BACT|nr:SRPBCC family protein [Flavihumibacter petaseus]GAO41582.1 hypothetical protein FPE01S_01_05960 [Flavihumibacter petaseus NBRC 106054]